MDEALLLHVATDLMREVSYAAKCHSQGSEMNDAGTETEDAEPRNEAVSRVMHQLREQILIELAKALNVRAKLAIERVGEVAPGANENTAKHLLAACCEKASDGVTHTENVTDLRAASKCADAARFAEEIEAYVMASSNGYLSSKSGKKEISKMLQQMQSLLRS